MFVLGLQGSPRIKGNTGIALSAFLDRAEQLGAECLRIDVSKQEITPCVECGTCEREGFCPINDDMQRMYRLLRRADLVVMATPIFFYGPTAYMKGLIDRTQALWARKYIHKLDDPKRHFRSGVLLSLGATKGKNLFEGVSLTAKYFFDAVGARFDRSLTFRKIEAVGDIARHATALHDVGKAADELVAPFLKRKKIVFVCNRNACRSQMAAAFAEQLAGDKIEAHSGGDKPADEVNPDMQKVMAEKGIDMGFVSPKSLDTVAGRVDKADLVVTLGRVGGCPAFAGAPVEAWDFADPAGESIEFMRMTRDKIAEKVSDLIKS